MASKLIQLGDGILVEVDAPAGEAQQISGGVADKVDAGLDRLQPSVIKACKTIMAVWKDLPVEGAEIEFGLSFEGEGNIYVTKARAGANFALRLTLKSSD